MPPVVLGLDIGGANLKAATADRRAVSLPFPLWKEPDGLARKLAKLLAHFPDAEEFAVTMTGELCDCYETKREGVTRILTAVQEVARSYPIRVWSTDGTFLNVEEARSQHLKVAAANWHALATFAGRFAPSHSGLLVDVGSTTTDIIPISYGIPTPIGLTDTDRLATGELLYAGTKRTPVFAIMHYRCAAEYFATTRDVYTVLGITTEDPDDCDTADGRPARYRHSLARLARMLGGDLETITEDRIMEYAREVKRRQLEMMWESYRTVQIEGGWVDKSDWHLRHFIVCGSGEFLALECVNRLIDHNTQPHANIVSLSQELGPSVSVCAPAYALAVLATERRPS
jgi:probable H4MPT-linked C1 transfer pathway protein